MFSRVLMDDIEELYNLYIDSLFAYGIRLGFNREQVMDSIHNVYQRIMLSNKTKELRSPKSYLFKSLRNELYDEYRKGIRMERVEGDIEDASFHLQISVEDMLIADELKVEVKSKINKALGQLSSRQREVIYLRYTQSYEYQQIADIMGIGVPSCRNLILKALKVLRSENADYFLLFTLLKNTH